MSEKMVTFGDNSSFFIPGRDEYYITTRYVGPSESIRYAVSRMGSVLRTKELGKVHPTNFDKTRESIFQSHLKSITDSLIYHEDIVYLVTNIASLGSTFGNTLSEKLALDFIVALIDGFRAKKCVKLVSDGYIPPKEGPIGGFHLVINESCNVLMAWVENCISIDFRNAGGIPGIHYVVGKF